MTPPISPESALARLRILVAFCAETRGLGISSTALSKAGQGDLAYVFPHTAVLAGLRQVQSCLETHHDSTVQSRGVYHLFRLPTALEARIHAIQLAGVDLPVSLDSAQTELANLATPGEFATSGAINLGCIELKSAESCGQLSAAYLHGFRAANLVTPFFTLSE
jgi:hypothetical protein